MSADIEEVLHSMRDQIVVRPQEPMTLLASGRAARTRRRRRRAVGATVFCAVFAAGALVLPHAIDRDVPVTTPGRTDPVPWISGGTLHLGDQTIPVPDDMQQSMAVVSDGVFLADDRHGVRWVHRDGRTQVIEQSGTFWVVSDLATSWVAWVEGSVQRDPELVVFDTDSASVIATLSLVSRGPRWGVLDEGDLPIAIDNGLVYYAAQDGDYSWNPLTKAEPTRVTSSEDYLRDHQSGVRAVSRQAYGDHSEDIVVISRPGRPEITVPGDGRIKLSPDGKRLLVFQGWLGDRGGIWMYDTNTGRRVAVDLPSDLRLVAATFDDTGDLILAGTERPDPPPLDNGDVPDFVFLPAPFDLIECPHDTYVCTVTAHDAIPGTVQFPS